MLSLFDYMPEIQNCALYTVCDSFWAYLFMIAVFIHDCSSCFRLRTHTMHNKSTHLMASLVGGVVCSSVLPLMLATILAYMITGYIRNELYYTFIKTCIGYICNGMVSQGSIPMKIIASCWELCELKCSLAFLPIRQL